MTNIFPYFIVCVARLTQSHVTVANQIVYMTIRHSTQKPTKQALPSPCVILKVIHAGVCWIWLARLMCLYMYISCLAEGVNLLPDHWPLCWKPIRFMNEFGCHEAKIEESEKAISHRESNPGHLWLEPPVLCTEPRQPDDHQLPQSSICILLFFFPLFLPHNI